MAPLEAPKGALWDPFWRPVWNRLSQEVVHLCYLWGKKCNILIAYRCIRVGGMWPKAFRYPPPKAQSLVRSVRDIKFKIKFQIHRTPSKPPPGLNLLLPKHLFTTFLLPLCSLFTTLTHDTANFDSNLVHLDSHAPFLMPSCASMLSACSHVMPTCPKLAPSRLPKLQF